MKQITSTNSAALLTLGSAIYVAKQLVAKQQMIKMIMSGQNLGKNEISPPPPSIKRPPTKKRSMFSPKFEISAPGAYSMITSYWPFTNCRPEVLVILKQTILTIGEREDQELASRYITKIQCEQKNF